MKKSTDRPIYGIDLSLRHGAVVRARWSKIYGLLSWDLIYLWGKGTDDEGVGYKDEIETWGRLSQSILEAISHDGPAGDIVIDFSKHIAHWGNRTQGLAVSYLVGLIVGCQTEHDVTLLSPHRVRSILGLKGNTRKSEVQEKFLVAHPQVAEQIDKVLEAEVSDLKDRAVLFGDILDALILTYSHALEA